MAGVIPRRLEEDGRRAWRAHAGRVPRNRKTTDTAPVQQTASEGMAGVIPRRLEEDGRRARPGDSDMDSPPENKKRSDKLSDLFYSLFFNPFYFIS